VLKLNVDSKMSVSRHLAILHISCFLGGMEIQGFDSDVYSMSYLYLPTYLFFTYFLSFFFLTYFLSSLFTYVLTYVLSYLLAYLLT